MSAITDARQELADAIKTADWACLAYVPEAIEPACYFLQPADPYVSPRQDDETFGLSEWSLSVVVYVMPELLSNEQVSVQLDDMVDHLLTSLPEGWGLDLVGKPGPFETSNWLSYGQPITLSRFITL